MKAPASPSPRPSPPWGERGFLVVFVSLALASGLAAQEKAQVATLEFVEGAVERAGANGVWVPAAEGEAFRLGNRLRTGEGALVYLAFPWMKLQIGGSTEFEVPDSLVLSAVLKQGRMEPLGTGGGIIKLVTDEAEIRGDGRIVVRREAAATMLTVRTGTFQVSTRNGRTRLAEGQGLFVAAGESAPTPLELTAAPVGLNPSEDPAYATRAKGVPLRWSGAEANYYVEVLPLHAENVVQAFDTGKSPVEVSIPWVGTFRWRVSARDASGVEGRPSQEGLISVVER